MYRAAGRQYEYPPSQYGQQQQGQGQGNGSGTQMQDQQQQHYQQQSRYMQQSQQQQQQYHPQQQQQQPGAQQQQGQGGGQGGGGGNVNGGNPGAGGGSTGTGSAAGDAQSQANSGPAGQEMNLASVLHYLQSEWRRWERDRNEWEIERAEMRARIALLEGQRRSAENLKVDLLRRVKMLEYALRQERTKTVSTAGKSTVAPSRLSTLQDEDRIMREEKEGSGSEGSEEGSQDRPKPNGIHPAAMSRISTVASRSTDSSPWKSIGTATKDPKARARSREYLKQCLQEITYLTSPGALNPLPPQPPINIDFPSEAQAQSSGGAGFGIEGQGEASTSTAAAPVTEPSKQPDRPRKALPEQNPPSIFAKSPASTSVTTSTGPTKADLPNGDTPGLSPSASTSTSDDGSGQISPKSGADKSMSTAPKAELPSTTSLRVDPTLTLQTPASPAARTQPLPLPDQHQTSEVDDVDVDGLESTSTSTGDKQILTAIYRPESKAAWREELRAANEQAEKASHSQRARSQSSASSASSSSAGAGKDRPQTDEEQLAAITLHVEDTSDKPEEGNSSAALERTWTSRKVLKSHLDIVRAVTFAHGQGVMLASAGDDCTIKVWYMEASALITPKSGPSEMEPIITLRGHTAPITSLTTYKHLGLLCSASLDGTIKIWHMPSADHDPYGAYQADNLVQTLEGHTEGIWSICIVQLGSASPSSDGENVNSGASRGTISAASASRKQPLQMQQASAGTGGIRPVLCSAGADGTLRTWEYVQSRNTWELKHRITFGGDSEEDKGSSPSTSSTPTPTCVAPGQITGQLLVGLSDGRLVRVDLKKKDPARSLVYVGDGAEDGSQQINAIATFGQSNVVVVGCEDGYIRKYINTSSGKKQFEHEFLAHPAAISSLAPCGTDPLMIMSSAVDCSVRVWDVEKETSVQDCQGHRQRAGEGVQSLAKHPELPVVASAGADGIVRIWSSV